MKIPAAVIFVALTSAAAFGQENASSSRQTTAPGNAENGRKLYTQYGCYQCHGREAQGGPAGPRIGPNPLTLPAFIRYVRAPRGEMPPYTEKLVKGDQDFADIHAFLSSRAAPPPASQLPPR
jgi:ubiquinol-cytochrome c reductase cytochrome c subunit